MDESSLRAQLNQLETSRSSLHSSFRFWEWVVVIGIALECVVLVAEYWDEWRAFLRATIRLPEKPKTWLFVVGFCGIAMVAGGITKELGIDSQIEGAETQIRKANDELYALLSKEAGNAAASAQTARDEAGKVQEKESALDVETRVLSTRIKEETAQWNAITPRQVILRNAEEDIRKAVLPFDGQKFVTQICGTPSADNESQEKADTRNALREVLTQNGGNWMHLDKMSGYWRQCGFHRQQGIVVFANPDGPPKTMEAAQTLSRELTSVLPPQLQDAFQQCSTKDCSSDDGEFPGAQVAKFPDTIAVLIGAMPFAKGAKKQENSRPRTRTKP